MLSGIYLCANHKRTYCSVRSSIVMNQTTGNPFYGITGCCFLGIIFSSSSFRFSCRRLRQTGFHSGSGCCRRWGRASGWADCCAAFQSDCRHPHRQTRRRLSEAGEKAAAFHSRAAFCSCSFCRPFWIPLFSGRPFKLPFWPLFWLPFHPFSWTFYPIRSERPLPRRPRLSRRTVCAIPRPLCSQAFPYSP